MQRSSRSQILVHWTGKDIDARLHNGTISIGDWRKAYVQRLLTTLHTGLWLTRGEEILGESAKEAEFRYYDYRVCFSEALLSRSDYHTARYGRLGFGFSRLFVLNSGGSPVIYVRNASSGVLQIFGALNLRIQNLITEILHGPLGRCSPGGVEMEAIVHDVISTNNLLRRLLPFLKRMSNENTDDFAFFEEVEWRIVAYPTPQVVMPATFVSERGRGNVQESSWEQSPRILSNSLPPPDFHLLFNANDVQLLVLPDDVTRADIWKDPRFKDWHGSRKQPLQILTLEECLHF